MIFKFSQDATHMHTEFRMIEQSKMQPFRFGLDHWYLILNVIRSYCV